MTSTVASRLTQHQSVRRRWMIPVATVSVLAIGAALRLTWGQDIEFKYDERWLYERATLVGHEPFPWLGMASSLRLLNPGLSIWVFIVLTKIAGATTPIGLARAVQVLNILALVLMAVFAWTSVEQREREPWLWAVALGAVNPMAVELARKIWQQSVLPVFTVGAVVGWWHRDKRWGAFLWGLIGVCMGQIHISGFFLTGGFALWAFLFDRTRTRWFSWTGGCLVGLAPMLPWLVFLSRAFASRPTSSDLWAYWFVEPLGVGLWQSLGAHFPAFLATGPSHVVGLLHASAILLGVVLFWLVMTRCVGSRERGPGLLIGHSPTAFTTQAVFLGCGALMTGSTLMIHRSYMNATFPLEFVWLAYMVVGGNGGGRSKRVARWALAMLWVVELLISVSFLQYIHVNGGAPGADYGTAYSAQPLG